MQRTSIAIDGQPVTLEYEWIASGRKDAPLIVFLHEGLGSAAMWGGWPRSLCEATGCRGLVFSRYGYGHSDTRPGSGQGWPLDYLEREARENLPALFQALGIDAARERPVIFGHSDGATIALLYAAAFPERAGPVVVLAPHVFVEQVARERIARLQVTWDDGRMAAHLARLHDDPAGVFNGWSRCWLSPAFSGWNVAGAIESIASPLLAVQGRQDQYGTLDQLYEIQRRVPHAELMVLEDCRHVPYEEHPEAVIAAVSGFLARSLAGGG
ncbi:alpha/beta fold hydrolase [Massilia cavernae]|uniref:alpha/beta fold hydrolase n=1 Tax=Massilia cavernae TaxID=2320864 RepID=UPI001E510768|nr:alpha/beta fold hydrolase [Massilia cavernae]